MFLPKILLITLTLSFGAIAYGQEPQNPTQDGDIRVEGRRQRESRSHDGMIRSGRYGFGKLRGMRALELTDEQRQQHRAIIERHLGNIKAQREELFRLRDKRAEGTLSAEDKARVKELRQQIHNSMQSVETEFESILTTEQRAKLEQAKTERKALHEEMRERRRELREKSPQ